MLLRQYLLTVFVFDWPSEMLIAMLTHRLIISTCYLYPGALAEALDWSIAIRKDKQQLTNLVQHRLLGYAKNNGKYAVPDQRIWQSHGLPSGKFYY